jgi:hypothetical protein
MTIRADAMNPQIRPTVLPEFCYPPIFRATEADTVMPGPDPGIHRTSEMALILMDCRVT